MHQRPSRIEPFAAAALNVVAASLTSPRDPGLDRPAEPLVGRWSRCHAADMLSVAGLTASPANCPGGSTPVARWIGSLPTDIPDSNHGAPAAASPAQRGSAAPPVPSHQPAAASRTFSPFAWQHSDDVHEPRRARSPPLPQTGPPQPRFEAGSAAGTPRAAGPADSPYSPYGWGSDAPLDGDSADGMSPRSGAGEDGVDGFAALAVHATGGESHRHHALDSTWRAFLAHSLSSSLGPTEPRQSHPGSAGAVILSASCPGWSLPVP